MTPGGVNGGVAELYAYGGGTSTAMKRSFITNIRRVSLIGCVNCINNRRGGGGQMEGYSGEEQVLQFGGFMCTLSVLWI